ncbi:RING finger protein 32 [Symbiodinium microadriaticum]|uniref:RING finger protein 32 n=1 Tax=Symbiodinium microadriaticum TaxID=2951 RepID=A0A1Q9D2M0_SYMMI|nr:RING finger protein 32 [Symbiodinium microadriaticum]
MRRHRSASPASAPGVVTTGTRGEVWRAVALQAHLLGKDRPQARSASARRRQVQETPQEAQTSRSAPCSGSRQAELDYDEKLKRHEASLTLAQRLGLVAKPAQPLTHEQWEQVKHASDSRQDSEVPCSICLEDFRTRPQVILSCSHVFHGECLRSFERFSGKRYCPLCRCPYFDATIHYSGLMVWRKKSASRIQRAWRGYRSRGEIFLQLRQPQLRAEAPTLMQCDAQRNSFSINGGDWTFVLGNFKSPGILWEDLLVSWEKGGPHKEYFGIDYTFMSQTYSFTDYLTVSSSLGVTHFPMTLWASQVIKLILPLPFPTDCNHFWKEQGFSGLYISPPWSLEELKSPGFDDAGWPRSTYPKDLIVDSLTFYITVQPFLKVLPGWYPLA